MKFAESKRPKFAQDFKSEPNTSHYQAWRAAKLRDYPGEASEVVVPVKDPAAPSETELGHMLSLIEKTNMAVYQWPRDYPGTADSFLDFTRRFGLSRLDRHLCTEASGISEIRVKPVSENGEYIPYTCRAINWHTDGYYNSAADTIRGLALHCVSPAAHGGENRLFDHELLYIALRERVPEHIHALFHPLAMTIPANIVAGETLRPDRTGPVFSVGPDNELHMRYTARTRSIRWREDPSTQVALQHLIELLASPETPIWALTLEPGQGLISNNVLHTRSAFEDDRQHTRLFLRARFMDRVRRPDSAPDRGHAQSQ